MNINKQIEKIKQKPDYIRERYVWLAVAICMTLLLIVWFFSLKIALNTPRMTDSQETAPSINLPSLSK